MQNRKKKTLYVRLMQMVRSIASLDVPVYAANASFFLLLSAFPALLLLLSLLRYTPLDYEALIQIMDGLIPQRLTAAIQSVIYSIYASSSTTVVSISAATALWSASRGLYGMLQGLNKVYGVREDRGYIHTRALSILYMFLFIIVLLLTLGLHVFGQTILSRLPQSDTPFARFFTDILPMRFFVLLGIQTVLFTGMFMVLPNRHNRFFDSLPGALLASMGWLVFSHLYSIYVDVFGDRSAVYGSLSTIALAMLWLYICMSIFFYGGALNKYLADVGFQLYRRGER